MEVFVIVSVVVLVLAVIVLVVATRSNVDKAFNLDGKARNRGRVAPRYPAAGSGDSSGGLGGDSGGSGGGD